MIQELEKIEDTASRATKKETEQEFPALEESKKPINIKDVHGLLPTLSTSVSIKASKPRIFEHQVQIEDDGSNIRLWVYVNGNGWKKTTLS